MNVRQELENRARNSGKRESPVSEEEAAEDQRIGPAEEAERRGKGFHKSEVLPFRAGDGIVV